MAERKNGCFNYPEPLSEFEVQDGYHDVCFADVISKMPRYVKIANNFSKGCKYAEHGYADKDKGCEGCKENQKN